MSAWIAGARRNLHHHRPLAASPDARRPGTPVSEPGALARLYSETDADLVVPRGLQGNEPLCAVYSSACCGTDIVSGSRAERLRAAIPPEGVRVEEIGPEMLAAHDPDGLLFCQPSTHAA